MSGESPVVGIWHFSYTVSDLDRSVKFYSDLLGFRLVHEQSQANEYTRRLVGYPDADIRVAMLTIGDVAGPSGHILELVEYRHPIGERLDTQPKNVGAAHLALLVPDVRALVARLKGSGVRFRSTGELPVAIEAGRNKGGYTCYLYDPDDFIIEIQQPRPGWDG